MLDILVDTMEIMKPEERLILLLSDLDTYRNMQMLNDLLVKGQSMTEETDLADYDKAIEMIEDVLCTDFQKLIRKEERLNEHRVGILGRLNEVYFEKYFKPDLEPKEEFKAQF